MYSIDYPESLKELYTKFVEEVQCHCPGVPFLFVGNKIDMRETDHCIQQMRDKGREFLTLEEGIDAARSCGAFTHIECSNLTQENLKQVFDAAIALSFLHKYDQLPGPKQKKKGKGRGCPVQ
jgi:GTPase SAR1 family protein